ncbi:MAG: ABC transporter ATP-binding protein [Bacillaceae bacterium]|nr:ABC transporter ATP-binding protein [Bacillaceae bacterium]
MMLQVESVSKSLNEQLILDQVSFQVKKGSCFGIIGPNGSGKSTLLKNISGYYRPSSGTVRIQGEEIHKIPRKKLAQKVAVLSQEALSPYPVSVFDTVLMGRYPHLKWYQREGKKDFDKVEEILELTELSHLQNHTLDTLSGGERQRVAIAKAMAQEPELLLLDEPTTYLDIGHQISILRLVQTWQNETDLTVIMVLHDLNLASQFCDQLLLLHRGKVVKIGTSKEVIKKDMLEKVYETIPEIIPHPKTDVPQILLGV